MADELTHESTPEDIQSFVDEIASERAGEKSDAEITASHSGNEVPNKTPVASGDETAADDVAETGKKSAGEKAAKSDDRSWLDDDLKAEVSAYGIGEDELADFSSREEVERALRFFDRSALEAGRKAMADGESKETGRDDKGRFTAKAEAEKPETQPGAKARFDVKLDKAVYDDEIVDEFTRMRDYYEQRLEALEARFLEVDARAEEQHFDSLVDALGHGDLFGKTDHENAKQLERRKDLHIAVKAQMLGLQALGRPTELSESLINRVARMVFAEELGKKDLKSRTSRISRQSSSRQGGGATRPTDPPESTRDWADRQFREMASV